MLRTPSGEMIDAHYYDGVWQPTELIDPPADRIKVSTDGEILIWNTDNFHSVLFDFHGYSVFIHGCRYGDIDRDTLLKIAQSFVAS
jgi:hypothetical protein